MTDPARPEPLRQLDLAFSAATLAHETIFRLHRELVMRGDEPPSELLAESARISLLEIPQLLAPATALATRWEDEAILDPPAAERTAAALTEEFDRVRADLSRLEERLRAIARELQTA